MSHPVVEDQLDAYLDGELAAVDARELEAHVAQCAECARFRDGRIALRQAIGARVASLEAPPLLHERVRAALRAAQQAASPAVASARRPVVAWRGLALAASFVLVALGSWQVAARRAAGDALTDALLASHVRSLMPGHLTDVLTSDQHTVKPWFNGRLDYSPPVYDFSGRGYPLLGGRLDYVRNRPVAALVYGRRQHLINVFLWPAADPLKAGPAKEDRRGYHLRHWTAPDYTYWVVSDLGATELDEFVGLLQQAEAASTR